MNNRVMILNLTKILFLLSIKFSLTVVKHSGIEDIYSILPATVAIGLRPIYTTHSRTGQDNTVEFRLRSFIYCLFMLWYRKMNSFLFGKVSFTNKREEIYNSRNIFL